MIAEVGAVGDDDVVEQIDAHQVAGFLHTFCQSVIITAGPDVVAGMIVTEGNDCGIGQQCLFHDDAHIDGRFADAAARDTHLFDEFVVLVHEQDPRFLGAEVLHQWVHSFVDSRGGVDALPLLRFFQLPTLAQFAGSEDADGLRLADAFVVAEFVNGLLPQRVQVVLAVGQHFLHEVDGTFMCRPRPNQNGQQFCIAE